MSETSERPAWLLTLTLAAAGLFACFCKLPLIWDGAYQFNRTLLLDSAYYYPPRFHSWIVWQPLVLAMRFTDNVTLLQAIYGMPFLLAPALGLILSWWVIRRHAPHLLVWVVFGVAAGPLPGQVFAINDTILQQHLFWPVFVGVLMPLSIRQRVVLTFLALMQLSSRRGSPTASGRPARRR